MTLGSSKFHFVSALDCLLQSGRNRPNYVSILVWRNFTLFYLSKTFNIVLQDFSRLIFHLDGHFNFSTLVSSWTWGSIDFLGVGCSGAISPTRLHTALESNPYRPSTDQAKYGRPSAAAVKSESLWDAVWSIRVFLAWLGSVSDWRCYLLWG